MRKFNEFVGLYPISKTLRFELKPIGKTLEHIQRNKLLEEDAVRADDYVKVKKLLTSIINALSMRHYRVLLLILR